MTNLVTSKNLSKYLDETACYLGWCVSKHKDIYFRVGRARNLDSKLDILCEEIVPWFIRNGEMKKDWRKRVTIAVKAVDRLNYNDLNVADLLKYENKLKQIFAPIARLKKTKSRTKKMNMMPASKILNFIFPDIFPKIDQYWINDVCLRKVNREHGNTFKTSPPIGISQYIEYLKFAARQKYPKTLLQKVDKITNTKNSKATLFEYCLLGFANEDISNK